MTNGVRLATMTISDLRGTTERTVEFPADGVLVEGKNEGGKSTILDAIRLLFGGRECSPDDVRLGAEKATIAAELTNGDKITRTIPLEGSTRLSGKTASGTKPTQEYLDKLVGGVAAFDVGKFLTASPAEQAKAVGDAMPLVLTPAHLAGWGIDGKHDLSGHGLVALARVAEAVGKVRTDANAEAKALRAQADVAATDAGAVALDESAPTLAQADAALRAASARLADLRAQQTAHRTAIERTEGTRARVVALRAEAERLDSTAAPVDPAEIAAADDRVRAASALVADLKRQLAAAEADHRTAIEHHAATDARVRKAAEADRLAKAAATQADELEASLAGSLPDAPADTAIEAAGASVANAERDIERARLAESTRSARARAEQADAKARASAERAAALQAQCDTLRERAPRELLAAARGIDGLGIGAKGITVDGVPFARLSTSRRADFAVRLALLGSPRAGWVQVDNLEAFDLNHRAEIVAAVLRAGRAFVGAVVSQTVLTITPIDAAAFGAPGTAETMPAPDGADPFDC